VSGASVTPAGADPAVNDADPAMSTTSAMATSEVGDGLSPRGTYLYDPDDTGGDASTTTTTASSNLQLTRDLVTCVGKSEIPDIAYVSGKKGILIAATGVCEGSYFVHKLGVKLQYWDGAQWRDRSKFRWSAETVNWKIYKDAWWSCAAAGPDKYRTRHKHVAWHEGMKASATANSSGIWRCG
jgi:hypothetical protein